MVSTVVPPGLTENMGSGEGRTGTREHPGCGYPGRGVRKARARELVDAEKRSRRERVDGARGVDEEERVTSQKEPGGR